MLDDEQTNSNLEYPDDRATFIRSLSQRYPDIVSENENTKLLMISYDLLRARYSSDKTLQSVLIGFELTAMLTLIALKPFDNFLEDHFY